MDIYDLSKLLETSTECFYIEADVKVNSKMFESLKITNIILDKINNSVKAVIECYLSDSVIFKAKKENITVDNVFLVKLVKENYVCT